MTHGKLAQGIIAAAAKYAPHARLFSSPTGAIKADNRFYRYGLVKGASDIIGWTTINGVAVFTAIEVKAGKDKLRPEQRRFLLAVAVRGGIAGVAREVADVCEIINDHDNRVETATCAADIVFGIGDE